MMDWFTHVMPPTDIAVCVQPPSSCARQRTNNSRGHVIFSESKAASMTRCRLRPFAVSATSGGDMGRGLRTAAKAAPRKNITLIRTSRRVIPSVAAQRRLSSRGKLRAHPELGLCCRSFSRHGVQRFECGHGKIRGKWNYCRSPERPRRSLSCVAISSAATAPFCSGSGKNQRRVCSVHRVFRPCGRPHVSLNASRFFSAAPVFSHKRQTPCGISRTAITAGYLQAHRYLQSLARQRHACQDGPRLTVSIPSRTPSSVVCPPCRSRLWVGIQLGHMVPISIKSLACFNLDFRSVPVIVAAFSAKAPKARFGALA